MATKSKGKKGKPAKAMRPAKPAKPAAKAAKPVKAVKPAKPTAPSLPAPPALPPPPPPRDEMHAPRDIGRLTRYGERFGAWKIDTRFLPDVTFPVASGAIAICDPDAPKSWRVFDRPVGSGMFRVMLSVARKDDGSERIAALVVHVGRPPIAKWTVAHYKGQKKPKSADALPRCTIAGTRLAVIDAGAGSPGVLAIPEGAPQFVDVPMTDGRRALAVQCTANDYAAYWAIDATDKPICLVVDLDVFTQKEWKARPTAV